MKLLTFAASLRKGSFNKQLIHLVNDLIQSMPDVEVTYADFADFRMPVYDGDLEASAGLPEGTKKIVQAIHAADALIISTPEYNSGISGALKNAIDWISRDSSNPLNKKFLLLLAASPSSLGGSRGLPQARVPFEFLGAYVYPKVFALANAHLAFDGQGNLQELATQERLETLLQDYIDFVQAYLKGLQENTL